MRAAGQQTALSQQCWPFQLPQGQTPLPTAEVTAHGAQDTPQGGARGRCPPSPPNLPPFSRAAWRRRPLELKECVPAFAQRTFPPSSDCHATCAVIAKCRPPLAIRFGEEFPIRVKGEASHGTPPPADALRATPCAPHVITTESCAALRALTPPLALSALIAATGVRLRVASYPRGAAQARVWPSAAAAVQARWCVRG